MEAYNQHSRASQATQTQLQHHNGKTLVLNRPFTDPSQTVRRATFLDDANEDRRQSATSLNRKRPASQTTTAGKGTRPKARPRQRRDSSSPEPTTKGKGPTADELLSKWQRVSQTAALSDSDTDDMGLDLSGKLPRLKLYLSPESRTGSLVSRDDEREYILVSQDGTQVSSSAPRRDLQLEVTIGRGDGDSVVSSTPSSAGLPVTQGGFAPPSVGSVKASQRFLRDGSIGYSSDSEGGRRDDSFLGERRRTVPLSKVQLKKGKGRDKVKERVTLGGSESEIEVVAKGKGKAPKGKGKLEEKNGKVKGSVTNLTKLATSKRDGKRKEPPLPPPPPPAKRPTVQPTNKTKGKKRVVLDTSEEDAESEDDISITPRARAVPVVGKGKGKAPVRREKTPPLKTGKTSKRRERTPPPTTTTAAKSKKNNKRKRLTLDDEGPVISSAESDSAPAPIRRKISNQVRTPTKNAKPKRPRAEIAIPSGFPSPMRAPVRVDEALLRPVEEPVVEVVVKKYRLNAEGEEEEIIYGPNGAEPLSLGEMVFADRPTVQLPPKKIPGLIARKISEEKCPYCDNFLPIQMSPTTEALFDKLRASRLTSSGNDWTRTIEFCERHSAESHVFPLGLHSGYPGEMNFTELRQRVKKMKSVVKRILKKPKDSPFYLFAARDLDRQGRRRWAGVEARNDEQRKNRLLPGYFGTLGKMTIASVLRGMLRSNRLARLVTEKATDPFNVEEYIEHVLVIEVAVHLIQEDMIQSKDDNEPYTEAEKRARALQILKESREYGRLRFGIGSEYLAEEDIGNGATQMVIADVRGLYDDTDEESEDDASSSEAGQDDAQDQASDSGNTPPYEPSGRQPPLSSPQRIPDDDDEEDDIRPAASPEILPLESSPVQSIAAHRSQSPEAIIVDPPTPSRNTLSQIDKSLAPVSLIDDDDVDDNFDDPGESLDAQALIDAANGVEETHYQQQNDAQTTRRTRAPPRFADGTLAISRDRPAPTNGSTGTRDSGNSRVPIIHDVDNDDDPLAQNLGQHQNLVARTQTRQSTSVNGQGGPSRIGGPQASRSVGPSRRANETPSFGSPYHHSATPQGPPRMGLTRGTARAGPSGLTGGRRAPEPRNKAPSMFIPKPRLNQALATREQMDLVNQSRVRRA